MAQAMGDAHTRPNGVAVFLGTMTIPLKDEKGETFTHKEGDIVTIGSPQLGSVTSVMLPAEKVQGLEKGPLALARNLAKRGLLIEGQETGASHAVVGR
jgi:fumarylacetoacetate (FAA) hydrolase family protein